MRSGAASSFQIGLRQHSVCRQSLTRDADTSVLRAALSTSEQASGARTRLRTLPVSRVRAKAEIMSCIDKKHPKPCKIAVDESIAARLPGKEPLPKRYGEPPTSNVNTWVTVLVDQV